MASSVVLILVGWGRDHSEVRLGSFKSHTKSRRKERGVRLD